ncbi:hypothetical protein DFH29DRAFT_810876 [Suillus ampliporus]|nr:hypothetical protein DFH29DRAFT_810876 [Suillus ampliporus]
MTTELAKLVDHFGGEVARTRCFLHIINLVAKSLIKEFDVPKHKSVKSDVPKHKSVESLDSAEQDLQDIAGDIDIEDEDTIAANGDGDPSADDADDTEGWIDEINELDDFDCDALQENIRPIKLVLIKLRKLAYKIIHSTTLLLPEWKEVLTELNLTVRIMPRDISTRWNSTFEMLDFAIEYRKAIDTITDRRRLGLGVPTVLQWVRTIVVVFFALTFVFVLVLHPRYKLEYFKAADWEDEWIAAARNIVQKVYERSYASRSVPASDEVEAVINTTVQVRTDFLF